MTQQYAHQPRWTSWFWGFFGQDDFKASKVSPSTLGSAGMWTSHVARPSTTHLTTIPMLSIRDSTSKAPKCMGPIAVAAIPNGQTHTRKTSHLASASLCATIWNNKTVLRGGTAIFYGPLQYSDFGGSMVQGYSVSPNPVSTDGFTPAFNIDKAFPPIQRRRILIQASMTEPRSTADTSSRLGRTSAIYSWSLQLQQQVTSNTVLAVGYLGNRGTHLHSGFLSNDNNMPKAGFALGDQLTNRWTITLSA